MGVQLVDIGVKMRKVVIFSSRACYKMVCNHPILVGLLCFLALLYRSFPFVFSVLLSVSPVLVCTAVLLGTLLSFGQPNIPEIEKEEKTFHDIVPLKTRVLQDSTVLERDESYSVDRYTTEVDRSIEGPSFGVNKLCEVERGDSFCYFSDNAPLIENESREIELGNRMVLGEGRELYDLGCEKKNEKNEERFDNDDDDDDDDGDGEILEHQYSPLPNMDDESVEFENEKSVDSFDSRTVMIGSPVLIDRQYSPIHNMDDENLEFDNDKSVDSFDSKMVNVDDSPPGSPLKREEEDEEEREEEDDDDDDDDDDGSFDSGSDRAESSSPDASMTDIMPMLDELHPLLDSDLPHPINLLHDGSDAASENSESDYETENQEVEAENDEKEATKDKQEQTKSAITWTEEDEKNLMDLGSSELERNQRLESLIARRRARKSMRMMVEKNLIDLEGVDLPYNIAPISTARNNPFDLHGDDDLGLPPIPGSAPSILHHRRNPFDLPYDSSEEKPDLKEDSFQHEFKTFHAKESLFRRHESFNVRPSSLYGPSRHEKKDSHLRPYFVPEETVSEGTGFSPFQRQSSELSDSKVSSIPESESIGSALDLTETEIHSKSETLERDSSHSSSSSLSEEGEKIFAESGLSGSGERSGHSGNVISREASLEGADFNIREPIYDLSPTRLKEISSSSVASDVHVESDMGLSPVLVDRTLSPADMEPVESGQEIEKLATSQPVEHDELLSEDAMLLKNNEVSILESSENFEVSFCGDPVVNKGVHLSNLDAHTDNDPFSESYEWPISPQYQSGSTEKSVPQSDKELPFSDCKHNTEVQEPPLIMMESVEEASITGQLNDLGIGDLDCEAQPITDTPSSPTFAPILHKVDEVTADAGQSYIQDNIFDEVQNDNHIDASKSHHCFTEAIEFDENVQYIVEDTDGIKEIDEGILSELDAVCDFSIKESVSSVSPMFLEEDSVYVREMIFAEQSENLNAYMVEQVHKNEEKIECGSSEFFTRGISLKEDFLEFAEREFPESMDHKSAEEESLLNLNSSTVEINPGMPLVEAESLKDLESIYEQAKLESMEAEVAFGLSQSPQEVELIQNSNTEDISPGLPLVEAIDPGMPLVEASSVKDLESIYEQAKLNSEKTEFLPQEVQSEVDTDSGMPLLVARSTEDLDSAFDQIDSKENEAHDEKASSESEHSKNVTLQEHSSLIENEINFEATSTEDTDSDNLRLHESEMETDSVLKEEMEDNAENPMKSSSQDVLVEATHNLEGGSSSVKDCDVAEDGEDGTKKQDFEVEKPQVSNLATTDAEKADQETTPDDDTSSAMDAKAKKEESSKLDSSSGDSPKD